MKFWLFSINVRITIPDVYFAWLFWMTIPDDWFVLIYRPEEAKSKRGIDHLLFKRSIRSRKAPS